MLGPADSATSVVLVGGHESSSGQQLRPVLAHLPGAVISPPGRALSNTISALLDAPGDATVVVVPLTFGRNPTMVADSAKTLTWLAPRHPGRLALTADFGTLDHLTAWLRTAAVEVHRRDPDAAVVISADAANPFDDAELHRIAHLVRTHGAGNEVEVSTVAEPLDVRVALQRLARLGFPRAVVVPAGFQRESIVPYGTGEYAGAAFYGPLMSEQAVVRVIRDRVTEALHLLGHGDDGIDAGLAADHGHGYAHSHAFDASEGAGHSHSHARGAAHEHTHHDSSLIHAQ